MQPGSKVPAWEPWLFASLGGIGASSSARTGQLGSAVLADSPSTVSVCSGATFTDLNPSESFASDAVRSSSSVARAFKVASCSTVDCIQLDRTASDVGVPARGVDLQCGLCDMLKGCLWLIEVRALYCISRKRSYP